jgi:hypothetical protein
MPLIRDYVAEHERATELGADAVRAGTPLISLGPDATV